VGWQTGEDMSSWTFLWPFFQKIRDGDRQYKLDLFWPIYRQREQHTQSNDIEQWWVWPFVGHVQSKSRDAWSYLWPLIWTSRNEDHAGIERMTSVLPFYWSNSRERPDGRSESFDKFWPFYHGEVEEDGSSEWQTLSPWLWHDRYGEGVQELYGFLWTLAAGRETVDASSFELAGNLYTSSERDGRYQSSMPLLYNYESDEDGATLRLFQFIPIAMGGSDNDDQDE